MTGSKARVIILWSHPRSCSTMFEMAFLQRKEFRVLHEPLGEAFYYGPERMSSRFHPKNRANSFAQYGDLTFAKEWNNIFKRNAQGEFRTFVKDMAHYIIPPRDAASTAPSLPDFKKDGNPTVIPSELLLHPDVFHAFLVRSPDKAVPSYYRLCVPPKSTVTGFDYFDPEEVGMRESRMLYDWLVKMGQSPLVIDAARLLSTPIPYMRTFCEACDVDFTEEMCHWEGGQTQEHFKKWEGFHDDAEKSNGIAKRVGTPVECEQEDARKAKEVASMPEIVQNAIAENMDHYNYLAACAHNL